MSGWVAVRNGPLLWLRCFTRLKCASEWGMRASETAQALIITVEFIVHYLPFCKTHKQIHSHISKQTHPTGKHTQQVNRTLCQSKGNLYWCSGVGLQRSSWICQPERDEDSFTEGHAILTFIPSDNILFFGRCVFVFYLESTKSCKQWTYKRTHSMTYCTLSRLKIFDLRYHIFNTQFLWLNK